MQDKNRGQSPQLYLITNDDDLDILCQKLAVALASGIVSKLQIRRKNVQADVLYHQIEAICMLVNEHNLDDHNPNDCNVDDCTNNCDIIINDDMQLAKEFGLGVHLGQEDGSVVHARELLGEDALIGRTCHGSTAMVKQAIKDGASYAAMGAVFSSITKPNAKTVGFDNLQLGSQICHNAGVDFCVIGGINSHNICQLRPIEIDYFAVVSDVLSGDISDVELKCQQWKQALASF